MAIVATPAADGSSKVKCDVPDVDGACTTDGSEYAFGEFMPFTYDLEALIPNVTGGSSISASITPLTNMAAAYAKSIGLTANGDTVKMANEKVAKLLGVGDILKVEPVDVTDSKALSSAATSEASIKYGYIAASIAAIANDDDSGNVGIAIDNLAQSYVNGKGELIGNEGVDDASIISLEEITAGALAIMDAEKGVNGGVFELVKDDIRARERSAKAIETDKSTSTETETVIATNNIDAAKAIVIVIELTTWGTTLKNDMTSGSDGTIAKVELAMETAGPDFEEVVIGMTRAVTAMIDAYSFRQSKDASANGTYPIADFLDGMDNIGGIGAAETIGVGGEQNMFAKTSGATETTGEIIILDNKVSISNASINGANISLSIVGPESISGTFFTVTLNPSSASNDNVELVFEKSSATITFDESISDISALDGKGIKPSKLTLNLAAKLGHKSISTAETKVNFEGSIETVVFINYSTWKNGETVEDINPSLAVFDGKFSIC